MHRQSLGSPGSKLHHAQGGRDDASSAGVTAADSFVSIQVNYAGEDEERKSAKHLSKSEYFVHLIPVLILICFLILYLSSRTPSENEMAQFRGFKAFPKPEDAAETGNAVDNFPKIVDIGRGDILAIGRPRNLLGKGRDAGRGK
ncbi:hypothetical protein DM860_002849 [Cuscuta australis]|uniref:Uncharacterized protein n=1 Tax=Cuscuta australis TaxID=267555 RepID=A0A328D1F8_9ASTE|nr:hypothetical protein DM860_002849 [Cuscuta australis]